MSVKLVIVDDAPFIQEILKNVAAKNNFQVVGTAKNGQQAVDVVLALKPDVVLMDLVMPIKNGIEATKEIIKNLPKTKIIACSTMDQNSLIMQAVQVGCCDYIIKPFKEEDLVKTIQSASASLGGQNG